MAATKVKPAFPGRSDAMGYKPGMSKLEYIVTQLTAARITRGPIDRDPEDTYFVDMAMDIIKLCEKAEAND